MTTLVTPEGVLVTDAEPQTEEWYAARREGITGTECAALAGISIGAFRTRCYRGQGPASSYRFESRTLYPFDAVAEWLLGILSTPVDVIDIVLAQCTPVGDCWQFGGYVAENGYGLTHLPGTGGRMVQTHRVVFEHFITGIPEGLEPDHLCRNRACCNPWHLDLVTHAVNVQRGLAGGEAIRLRQPRCPCGRDYDRFYPTPGGGINRRCSHCMAAYKRRWTEGSRCAS